MTTAQAFGLGLLLASLVTAPVIGWLLRDRAAHRHYMAYDMKRLPPPPPDPWEGMSIPVPRRTAAAPNECVECGRFFKPRGGLAVHRARARVHTTVTVP